MKKSIALITLLFAFMAFTPPQHQSVKKSVVMTVAITQVIQTSDGNQVWFDVYTDTPTPYHPGMYATGKQKGGNYDWGGLGEPRLLQVNGTHTTGYFLDGPLTGNPNQERNYKLVDWDANGVRYETPVYNFNP